MSRIPVKMLLTDYLVVYRIRDDVCSSFVFFHMAQDRDNA